MATERSGVDVGLPYEHAPPTTYHGQYLLQAELTQELSRDVQLVVLNGAPGGLAESKAATACNGELDDAGTFGVARSSWHSRPSA
jgi:hypothetical protein